MPPPPSGGGWQTPPPGGPAPAGLPWERRSELGFLNAFVETIKLFVTSPAEAWQRTKEKGDFAEPLIFAILVSWIGIAVSTLWSGLFGNAWVAFLPADMKEKMAGAFATNTAALLIQVGLAPIFVLIGLFIGAGIFHLMLSLLGAARQPFEATARVVAYGVGATSLLGLIPFCGGIIGGLYGIYLYIVGLADVHDTDITKAAIAVLTPAVVCCVLFALLWGTIAALIFGAAAAGLATQ